jgi:four helix bundle protein
MIISYTDIEAFQKSKKLYPEIVRIAKNFPPHGRHLRDQMCRSANSIHANIAEGYGRSIAEFKMYLTRALGSCNEAKSHLDDAVCIELIDPQSGQELIAEYTIVGKQIYRLRQNWK